MARVSLRAWQGDGRFELAFVDLDGDRLSAHGTQLAPSYRLTYALHTSAGFVTERLQVEVETLRGARTLDLQRGTKPLHDDVLDADLEGSPLFNSLPVLRDALHAGGEAREYTMAFVNVPDLSLERTAQRYIPLGRGVVRFRSGDYTADLEFDRDGFVARYPGLAEAVR
jgi:hypothetical protein